MLDIIKKLFVRKPKVEFDENDREAFCVVAGTFEVNTSPEGVDWRNVWGLSKDSGLSEKAVEIIIDRYNGRYFEKSPFEIAGSKFYRLTNEGINFYNMLGASSKVEAR